MNEYCTLQNKDELYDNHVFFSISIQIYESDTNFRFYLYVTNILWQKNKQHRRHTFMIYFHNNNDQR